MSFSFFTSYLEKVNKIRSFLHLCKKSEFNEWVRCIMVLPMLPEEEIASVYRLLSDVTPINLNDNEIINLQKLKSYIKREWKKEMIYQCR